MVIRTILERQSHTISLNVGKAMIFTDRSINTKINKSIKQLKFKTQLT